MLCVFFMKTRSRAASPNQPTNGTLRRPRIKTQPITHLRRDIDGGGGGRVGWRVNTRRSVSASSSE